MNRALLLVGACALLAAPAFAQSPSTEKTPDASTAPAATQQTSPERNAQQNAGQDASTNAPAASTEQTPSTADFVKKVAVSDMFEIQSSKLALKKHDRQDRHFAQRMIHDHTQTTTQLKGLVHSGKVKAKLPSGLDSEHQQMLDQLRKDSSRNFDKDYDQMQLKGHQDAVALFQAYAQNGDNPELKRWAARTLPHLQEHLSMAEKLSQNGRQPQSAQE